MSSHVPPTPLSSLPQRSSNPSRLPPSRSRQSHPLPPQYRNDESNTPPMPPRERQGPKAPYDPSGDRGSAVRGGRGGVRGSSVVIEDAAVGDQAPDAVTASQPGGYPSALPRRQQQEQRGGVGDRFVSGLAASDQPTIREASPPAERPPERKSYALARRTRSRPADLGSKQPSVEESATSSPSGAGGKGWAGDEPGQGGGGAAALTELDQDVARLSLTGQSWSQSPASYFRSEMRGESSSSSSVKILQHVFMI